MRNFVLGILVALVSLVLGALAYLTFGWMPTVADRPPSRLESHIAMSALDASMERHAARLSNPVPATDENLIEGMKIYTANCALCHGSLDKKPSSLEKSLYPRAPQLIIDPEDDPEWHIFYAVETGVRYTGMPAWDKALSPQQVWEVTAFLSRVEKLPPAVQEYWKKSYGVNPAPSDSHGEEETKH